MNIEQRTSVVHSVKCCTHIKQDECSYRTNDIIHDTHYSSFHVMMSAVCGLIRWKTFMTFSMCSEPRCNELGGKTQVRYWSIRVDIFNTQRRILESWKTRADVCVSARSPDCRDTLQFSLSILEQERRKESFMSQIGTDGSNEQCLTGVRDSSRVTSSTPTGSKMENGVVTSCVLITGGGEIDVDSRILSTFDEKKAANLSTEKWLEFWCDGADILIRSFVQRVF